MVFDVEVPDGQVILLTSVRFLVYGLFDSLSPCASLPANRAVLA